MEKDKHMQEFTIKVKMSKRWIPHFLGMLKYMSILGHIGASRELTFFADGDGDFKSEFEWDIDTELVQDGLKIDGEESIKDRFYDAG